MANSEGTKKARGSKKNRKYKRNEAKCKSYRLRIGKPRGKGIPGNKRGKNR
jgi:hypothetical protein